MIRIKLIQKVIILFTALILFVSCDLLTSNDEKSEIDFDLETKNLETDSEGIATFEVSGVDVEVQTKNEDEDPVANIKVRASVSENYLTIITEDPSLQYYPNVQILPLESIEERSAAKVSTSGSVAAVTIVVGVVSVGLWLWEMYDDPPYIEEVIDDGGITKKCVTGDLNDVITTIGGVSVAAGGMGKIFHIGQTVTAKLGYTGTKTVAASTQIIDAEFDLIVALMGETVGIFDKDIQVVCWGEDKDESLVTPFYWEDIELNRDFELRLTLTWGENPEDLDSHLFTPEISGDPYHIFFANEGSLEQIPFAELDVDDVTSFGPENITINELYPGTYHYAIHHFSGTENITKSEAEVTVSPGIGIPITYKVPEISSGENWWWHVFEIDGSTGNIEVVNEISSSPPVNAFKQTILNENIPEFLKKR